MKNSFVVLGLGRFGSKMAIELSKAGKEVLAIDRDADLVQNVSEHVTHAVVGDCKDIGVLRALDIEDFDCAIVAIGDDFGASVLTIVNLKELGVPYVISKAHDETQKRALEKLGADKVIIPEYEFADRLAKSLISDNVLDYIELSNEYGIMEIPVPAQWVGKTLRTLNIRAEFGVNVLAFKRNNKIDVPSQADYIIKEGAIMLILGDVKALSKIQKIVV